MEGLILHPVGLEAVAASLLVALAVAVVLLPARRDAPAWLGAQPGARDGHVSQRPVEVDIGLLLIEVSTLLRAGATPASAWERALHRAGISAGAAPEPDGVPPALVALGAPPRPWWSWRSRGAGPTTRRPAGLRGLVAGRAARRRRAEAAMAVPGAVAACRLTVALGAPLAGVLESVAQGVAESGRAAYARRTALSGPRSTARLLACLPVVGLALGACVGADPRAFLLDAGWGSLVGAVGLGLIVVGHLVTRRLVKAAEHLDGGVDEALVLDLAGAALTAGASVPGCLSALGSALEEPELGMVGKALLLGAHWREAWEVPQDAAWLARRRRLEGCLRPGWEDGASPGPLLAGSAASLRAGRSARDQEEAERLAVRLVVPLGLCHLPAFLALGVVPVVTSVGLDLLTG